MPDPTSAGSAEQSIPDTCRNHAERIRLAVKHLNQIVEDAAADGIGVTFETPPGQTAGRMLSQRLSAQVWMSI